MGFNSGFKGLKVKQFRKQMTAPPYYKGKESLWFEDVTTGGIVTTWFACI